MPVNDPKKLCCEVERFLKDFKNLLDVVKRYPIRKHKKNEDTKNRLGLTRRNCIDVLYSLTTEDFHDGPKPDKYERGNYYEFGTKIEGNPIYIKIKIACDDYGNESPVCFSFHDPEFPLRSPLKGIKCK